MFFVERILEKVFLLKLFLLAFDYVLLMLLSLVACLNSINVCKNKQGMNTKQIKDTIFGILYIKVSNLPTFNKSP
jgi:hypothetical protein